MEFCSTAMSALEPCGPSSPFSVIGFRLDFEPSMLGAWSLLLAYPDERLPDRHERVQLNLILICRTALAYQAFVNESPEKYCKMVAEDCGITDKTISPSVIEYILRQYAKARLAARKESEDDVALPRGSQTVLTALFDEFLGLRQRYKLLQGHKCSYESYQKLRQAWTALLSSKIRKRLMDPNAPELSNRELISAALYSERLKSKNPNCKFQQLLDRVLGVSKIFIGDAPGNNNVLEKLDKPPPRILQGFEVQAAKKNRAMPIQERETDPSLFYEPNQRGKRRQDGLEHQFPPQKRSRVMSRSPIRDLRGLKPFGSPTVDHGRHAQAEIRGESIPVFNTGAQSYLQSGRLAPLKQSKDCRGHSNTCAGSQSLQAAGSTSAQTDLEVRSGVDEFNPSEPELPRIDVALARLRSKFTQYRANIGKELDKMCELQSECQRLTSEYQSRLASKEQEYADHIRRLQQEHDAALSGKDGEHAAALVSQTREHQAALAEMDRQIGEKDEQLQKQEKVLQNCKVEQAKLMKAVALKMSVGPERNTPLEDGELRD